MGFTKRINKINSVKYLDQTNFIKNLKWYQEVTTLEMEKVTVLEVYWISYFSHLISSYFMKHSWLGLEKKFRVWEKESCQNKSHFWIIDSLSEVVQILICCHTNLEVVYSWRPHDESIFLLTGRCQSERSLTQFTCDFTHRSHVESFIFSFNFILRKSFGFRYLDLFLVLFLSRIFFQVCVCSYKLPMSSCRRANASPTTS